MVRRVKWSSFGLAALTLALSVNVAQAQVNGTVVLKSGEKHTGRNISYRIDRREVVLAGGQRFGVDQVAYVDFGGNPDVSARRGQSGSGRPSRRLRAEGSAHRAQSRRLQR